jgi:periplasmic protein TonB
MRADVFEIREPWRGPLTVSAIMHAALFGGIIGYAVFLGHSGENWGGAAAGEGAMSATLVSSAAIPLPRPQVPAQNIVANDSPGVTQSQPKVEPIPEPKAIPIPETIKAKPKPKPPVVTESKPREPVQQATNVVPFGQGGPVAQHFAIFKTVTGTMGINMGNGGDFGNRYSWYVDAVRRKVTDNWLRYEIDPHTASGERVYLVFDILRNGQPANVQLEKSSGISSLDQSAIRALQRIDTFGPLPNDYAGNRVSVEFYFEK